MGVQYGARILDVWRVPRDFIVVGDQVAELQVGRQHHAEVTRQETRLRCELPYDDACLLQPLLHPRFAGVLNAGFLATTLY